MSHWSCSIPGCDEGALLGPPGTCKRCFQHFCFNHISDVDKHPCSSRDKELWRRGDEYGMSVFKKRRETLLAKIDVSALIKEAKQLRPGYACQGPTEVVEGAQGVIVNGGNIHIVLTFEDGVKWLARIKQSWGISPPPHVQRIEKLSEVATCRTLHDSGIMVPRVWTPPAGGQANDLNHFFVEFVSGDAYSGFHGYSPITREPSSHELIIIESYAKFQMSLEKITFPSIGSPTFDSDGKVIIGPIITVFAPLAQTPYYLGPFSNPKERYLAFCDMVMDAVLGDRWCSPEKSVSTYQAMLEAKRLVQACKELGEDIGPFYIKHGEPKCDHFLLDDQGDITAMLDWEWSMATSKADAFAAPWGFVANEFWHGNNNLSLLEIALAAAYRRLGRPDLAAFVENGKIYQRLDFLLQGGYPDYGKIKRFRACMDDPQQDWPKWLHEWNGYLSEKYKEDEGVKKLMAVQHAREEAARMTREVRS